MRGVRRYAAILALVFISLIYVPTIKADTGPHPTISITLVFQGTPIAVVKAELLACDDAACATSHSIARGGAPGMGCFANSCQAMLYGGSPFYKLVITFADRVRESNVFVKRAFAAQYTVTVFDSGLVAEEDLVQSFGNFALMGAVQGSALVPSLLVTIVVETLVAGLLLLIRRRPKRLALWVPVINLVTLPIVWWFVTGPVLFVDSDGGLKLLIAEVVVIVVEAGFLYLISRKVLSPKNALTMSLIMNLASFLAGYILLMIGL